MSQSGIAADGGGGSGSCDTGTDGQLPDTRAAGPQCSAGGSGGDGGAGGTPDGTAGEGAQDTVSAGSGGGGVGRIRINVPTGGFTSESEAVVSPTPSVGSLGIR